MSNFDVNNFKPFLTYTGKYITDAKQLDLNTDGTVTNEEYLKVLKGEADPVDTVEISGNEPKEEPTPEEIARQEKEMKMDEIFNKVVAQIEAELTEAGYPSALDSIKTSLQTYLTGLKENIDGIDLAGLEAGLIAVCNSVKDEAIDSCPEKLEEQYQETLSEAVDEVLAEVLADVTDNKTDVLRNLGPKASVKAQELKDEWATNGGNGGLEGLKEHVTNGLAEWLNSSDKKNMESAINNYPNAVDQHKDTYIDDREWKNIQQSVKELLSEMKENGIKSPTIDGLKVDSDTALTALFASYNDKGDGHNRTDLLNAIDSLLSELSDVSIKDGAINAIKEANEAEEARNNLKGEAFAVDLNSDIDLTKIPGYSNGETEKYEGKIGKRKHSQEGLIKAKENATEILENLKAEYKEVFARICKENGIEFNEVAELFEATFDESIAIAVDASCIETQKAGAFKRSKAEFNVRTLVDTFNQAFNTKFAESFNAMKESDKDMDLQDISYTDAVNNETDNQIDINFGLGISRTINVEDPVYQALQSGEGLVFEGEETGLKGKILGVDKEDRTGKATEMAAQLVENLRDEFEAKAKEMCKANGIEFNQTAFDNIFEIAKANAIDASVVEHSLGEGKADAGKFAALANGNKLLSAYQSVFNPRVCFNTLKAEISTTYTQWVNGQVKTEEEV